MATKRNVSSEQGKKTQPVIDEAVAHGWEIPDFSIKEIRDAIPAHCFERDTLRSFSHVAYDLSIIAALGYAATFIDTIPYSWVRVLLWPAYWIAQGIVATGVWVIAHECGHQAFSPSKVCTHFLQLYIVHMSPFRSAQHFFYVFFYSLSTTALAGYSTLHCLSLIIHGEFPILVTTRLRDTCLAIRFVNLNYFGCIGRRCKQRGTSQFF